MLRLFFNIQLMFLIGLLQYVISDGVVPFIKPGRGIILGIEGIMHNWNFGSNDSIVLYARNFKPDRQFAYVRWDPSKKYCLATSVSIRKMPPESVTCQFFFRNKEGTVELVKLLMSTTGQNPRLMLEWINKLDNGEEKWHMSSINTRGCDRRRMILDSEATAASPSANDQSHITDFVTDNKFSTIETLNPGEVHTIPGDLFSHVYEKNDAESKLKILQVNHGDARIKLVGHVNSEHKGNVKRESLAHGKYGVCWMNGTEVSCEQSRPEILYRDEKFMHWSRLKLVKKADWFNVYNLEEPAMLVVAGQCPEGKCNLFDIYKIQENDQVKGPILAGMSDVQCDNDPMDLTMDIMEDPGQESYCFHMVCLEKYSKQPEKKGEKMLQYRRFCVSKDNLENHFNS